MAFSYGKLHFFSTSGNKMGRVKKPDARDLDVQVTRAELNQRRERFWAGPHAHGREEQWLALETASQVMLYCTEPHSYIAHRILDKAGLEREFLDMRVCYDKKGVRYELPLYFQTEPSNLIED